MTSNWTRPIRLGLASLLLAATSWAQCGSFDTRFGVNGLALAGGIPTVHEMLVWDDGTGPALYVAGSFSVAGNAGSPHLARFDGTTWSSIGTFNSEVKALAVHDDGSGPALYMAGGFTTVNGMTANHIARWDGTTLSAVPGMSASGGTPDSLASYDDGTGAKLFVGGFQMKFTGLTTFHYLASWDGSVWTPFPSTVVDGAVYALLVHDDGSGSALYLGGGFTAPARDVARWNGVAFSAVATTMGGSFPTVTALCEHDEGAGPVLFAAGSFASVNGVSASNVARWNGTVWSAVGTGLNGAVMDLGVCAESGVSRLYAAGEMSGSVVTVGVWNGTLWSGLGGGVTQGNSRATAVCGFDDGSGEALFVGGPFWNASGQWADGFARWKQGVWSIPQAVPPGLGISTGEARAIVTYDDGSGPALYATGMSRVPGVTVSGTARFDGQTWTRVGTASSYGYAIAIHDAGLGPKLFVTGFSGSSAVPSGVGWWNGTAWQPIGGSFSSRGASLCSFDDGSGPALFVGGNLSTVGGVAVSNIARWNGTTWSALGLGVGPSTLDPATCVAAMIGYDDGSGPALYCTGALTTAGGNPAARIAKWNGAAWSALGTGLDQPGTSLLVHDDGSGQALYVGGSFTIAGGVPASGIARWNGAWSSVGTGLTGSVRSLGQFNEGSGTVLIAAGTLSVNGGLLATRAARWDGTSWSSLSSDTFSPTRPPQSMAVFHAPGSTEPVLYMGGTFYNVGPHASMCIAAWHGCPNSGSGVCPGDGSGAACPCANESAIGSESGCLSSLGLGGKLTADGFANLTQDTFTLHGSQLPNGPVLYFQSTNGTAGIAFGDGLFCAGGGIIRLALKFNSANQSSFPETTDPSITTQGQITAVGTRFYQGWYRDAASFCTSATFNLTNAWQVTFGP